MTSSKRRVRVVVIGGGNGTGVVLSSLKETDTELSAIVSMADDGGSTGMLRDELNASAVGDIQQCLVALTENISNKNLFKYRFSEGTLDGHSFGNMFLTSAEKATGSLYKAIGIARNLLDVDANIVPVTDDKPYLIAKTGKQTIKGVYSFANTQVDGKKVNLDLSPHSDVSDAAESLIKDADIIIIAPGNFYCSILPALIVEGVVSAINQSKAKKVFVSNLINFQNHTANYKVEDYLAELERIAGLKDFDYVICNDRQELLDVNYVKVNEDNNIKNLILEDLVSKEKTIIDPNDRIAHIRSSIKHDKAKLNKIFIQIFEDNI